MVTNPLTEHELQLLFTSRSRRKPKLRRFLRAFFLFILVYWLIFTTVNFKSLKQQILYWYKTEYLVLDFNQTKQSDQTDSSKATSTLTPEKELENNHVYIDAINVNAPISWRVENSENIVSEKLRQGVIHINGTALPGEVGNVFITGHSSDLPWSKGEFKNIFALLNRLVVGDTIVVKYQDKQFTYKVSRLRVVAPDDLSVMSATKDSILTLMTCTPVGTTLRRLIVTAKQVDPSPDSNKKQAEEIRQSKLPRTR